MKIIPKSEEKAPAPAVAASPSAVVTTSVELMENSETDEAKQAAFMALFYAGTDETLTKAVDYFYQSPAFFSQTVKGLAKTATHKENLKIFLQKLSDTDARVSPFMTERFDAALRSKTWSEYRSAMRPIFALKDTFEGVDKNRRQSRSCPSAYDMLINFNDVSGRFTKFYAPLLYKVVGTLDMDK